MTACDHIMFQRQRLDICRVQTGIARSLKNTGWKTAFAKVPNADLLKIKCVEKKHSKREENEQYFDSRIKCCDKRDLLYHSTALHRRNTRADRRRSSHGVGRHATKSSRCLVGRAFSDNLCEAVRRLSVILMARCLVALEGWSSKQKSQKLV